jgi:basic membrane protein A
VLAALVAAAAAGCGGEGEDAGGRFRVGLVFDVGGKGDKSFNDSAYEGLTRARADFPIQVADFEPGQDADREVGLRKLAARGFDMVIGVGFLFTEAIRSVAADYPDVHFVLVDGHVDGLPNVTSLVFREHEGSFLVGALAAMASTSGTVGFVGGMDVPLIHKFEAGYRAGAQHVKPKTKVLVGYAGVRPEAFADPVRGKEIALAQIGQGADVVFHASGVTGLGVIEAAREAGKLAIGVDANQNGVAPGTVLTSMIKRVDNAIYRTIADTFAGRPESGIVELGLADEGVGFSVDEHNIGLLTDEMLVRAAAIRDSIIDGTIRVPHETGRS